MLLFSIVPTFVELFFVCGVLLSLYEVWFSLFTVITIVGYVTFTLIVTEVSLLLFYLFLLSFLLLFILIYVNLLLFHKTVED